MNTKQITRDDEVKSDSTDAFAQMKEQNLQIDDLLCGTFQSVLRIEEKSLNSKLAQGLTIADIHTIVAVGLYGKKTMTQTAAQLNVTTATLSVAINKLESMGYVVRERSDQDRRKIYLVLTKAGKKVYRAHHLFHEHMLAEALCGLSIEERQVLAEALSRLKKFFDERA